MFSKGYWGRDGLGNRPFFLFESHVFVLQEVRRRSSSLPYFLTEHRELIVARVSGLVDFEFLM